MTRQDSNSLRAPKGTRIAIHPAVDLEKRGLSRAGLAVARTLKHHGCCLEDNSGSEGCLKAEQTSARRNPWDGLRFNQESLAGITRDDFRRPAAWLTVEPTGKKRRAAVSASGEDLLARREAVRHVSRAIVLTAAGVDVVVSDPIEHIDGVGAPESGDRVGATTADEEVWSAGADEDVA